MQLTVMLVKGDYGMTGVHARMLGMRQTASELIVKTTILVGATGIQMTLRLMGVGVTNTLLGAALISPESLVAVVTAAVVGAATQRGGHKCHHPGRTLGHTGIPAHKPGCRGMNSSGSHRWQGRLFHRTHNGYSMGRTWLLGEEKRITNTNNMQGKLHMFY